MDLTEANLIESCYVNIQVREHLYYEKRTTFMAAAVGLIMNGPNIPAGNFQILLFLFCFHVYIEAQKMSVDRV